MRSGCVATARIMGGKNGGRMGGKPESSQKAYLHCAKRKSRAQLGIKGEVEAKKVREKLLRERKTGQRVPEKYVRCGCHSGGLYHQYIFSTVQLSFCLLFSLSLCLSRFPVC